jgi:hypothetical protein
VDQYATLFRFNERYRPKVPGADEMGTLWHIHVTDDVLDLDESGLMAIT